MAPENETPETETPEVETVTDLADLKTLAPTADAPAADAPAEAPAADAAPAAPIPGSEDHGVSTQGPQIQAVLREQQLDKQGRAYATGRRKDAVARVWLKPGTGKIVVNGRDQEVYFARPTLRLVINQVFDVAERAGQYDIVATVKGAGFLTRDSRVVERKKYGRAKARKSFQFSKR